MSSPNIQEHKVTTADEPKALDQTITAKLNRLMKLAKADPARGDIKFSDDEKVKLEKQYARHMDDYRFYLDFGLKATGVFYAVLGTTLSLYFSNNPNLDRGLVIFFLLVPIAVSLILGGVCLAGAILWGCVSKYFYTIAEVVEIVMVHQVGVLTWLLSIFGVLFVCIGIALILLMIYLT